ncbi:MAG: TIGR03086 family metal-binding protein [Acidimicrobiales bacterium]
MSQLDLRPAADRMARLLEGIPDDALRAPTPCAESTLDVLVDHVGGFAQAFTAAATKDLGELTSQPPVAHTPDLEPGWRARITKDLTALAEAWAAPDAWDGMTQAGGVDLPGEVAGRVALDELVVHGWDIARASGQAYECDDADLREIEATVQQFRGGNEGEIPGLFGPLVPVPDDAPLLHRVLGLTGRDPSWSRPSR